MNQYISFMEKNAGIVPRGRPFIKMHGLRNDFIVVDGRTQTFRPSVEEIVRICDRREGVGADELLIIDPLPAGSADAAAFVRIFNPDGREVEACGNASRCVGWLLLKESKRDKVSRHLWRTARMPAGSVTIELQADDSVAMTGPVETCFAGYLPVLD
jgi:diaminopimelate epimerase